MNLPPYRSWSALCLACFVIFLILKLTNTVDWHWLIVCLPLIVGAVLQLVPDKGP